MSTHMYDNTEDLLAYIESLTAKDIAKIIVEHALRRA